MLKSQDKYSDQAKADMAFALSHAETRRLLKQVLAQCNLMGPSYSSAGSGLDMAYNEGLRAVGLWLLQYIDNTAPSGGLRLLLTKDDGGE